VLVFREYLSLFDYKIGRRDELAREIITLALLPTFATAVAWLQCFRGFQHHAAMVLATEIVDWRRFERPTQLMAYLGLVSRENSSGPRERKGSITKAGNRRILAQQAVIAEKIEEAVAEIAKEVELWMQIEKFGLADQVLAARFGFARSDLALSLPGLRDWASPVLTVTDSMRPTRRKPQGVVVSNTASATPEMRKRNALRAVHEFLQSKSKVRALPPEVQAILAESPISPDEVETPEERIKREASAAVIGTGRRDPVVAQAATEALALGKLGVPSGGVHRA
jgi:hypothetical protein